MAERIIEVFDEQLETTLGTLSIFEGGRKGPTYAFKSQSKELSDQAASTDLPPFLDDALPDSWGRKLIKRSLGGTRTPFPHELLLLLSDSQRIGSLRFRENGQYLSSAGEDIPPLLHLGRIDMEIKKVNADPLERVSALIGIGSHSIGGARPKATVRDSKGQLWIAKFSSEDDNPVLEALIMDAARSAGILAAETSTKPVANSHVLLSKRFDRSADGKRIGMRSLAATLDINDSGDGLDWGDIASAINNDDFLELWRRALLGTLVHNVDDHIRNHSQIRVRNGKEWVWQLSPVYDITHDPNPHTPHALSLLGEHDASKVAKNLPSFAQLLNISTRDQLHAFSAIMDAIEQNQLPTHPGALPVLQHHYSLA